MTNKKADIGMPYLIGGIIALVVLFSVLFIIFSPGESFANFFSWLPSFGNNTIEPIESIEIFRYNIETSKIEYYDGTQFAEFKQGEVIRLGDKEIKRNDLEKDFGEYYLNERERKIIQIEDTLANFLQAMDGAGNKLLEARRAYLVKANSEELNIKESELKINAKIEGISVSGNVPINLIEDKTNKTISNGHFILYPDNHLEFNYVLRSSTPEIPDSKEKVQILYSTDLLWKIFNSAKEWRDSVFRSPIAITIYPATQDIKVDSPMYICPQLRDNKYIVIDLANKIDKGGSCS